MADKSSKSIVSKLLYILIFTWFAYTIYNFSIITISNNFANKGEQFVYFNNEIERLRLENQILQNDIASYSSLRYIEMRAKQLGFVSIKKLERLRILSL